MADWFIGSASKSLEATSPVWAHAIGFRSEHALMALVVCDIADVNIIDRNSLRMHINLHPIEAVDVILVASGAQDSITLATQSADTRHAIIHRLVDCIIDALTFGCPAQMRVTATAIQWRKFDDYPIATLTRHNPPITHDIAPALTATCGDPVLVTTSTVAVAIRDIHADLHQASAQSVTHVAWQQVGNHWQIMVNDQIIALTHGVLATPYATNVWCTSIVPTQMAPVDDALTRLLEVYHA